MSDAMVSSSKSSRGLSTLPTGPGSVRDMRAHRPEIDGLRALAVLAVVFYHYAIFGFGGGFVGVDIFFVISGFLIGGILWRELSESGTLSLSAFYMRRIRRLAPAFIVVMIVVTLACYFILLPFEFRAFGKSLISAVMYFSNVQFFREAGYFDTASDQKVLLHTWSLSVEEQFYIVIPMLMLLLRRNRKVLVWTLSLLFAASLAACILVTPLSNNATFFLFPFRAWQMLAGVLLAIYLHERESPWPGSAAASWLGFAMIAVSIAFLTPTSDFPGLLAVLPTAGALIILLNGHGNNAINRTLSSSWCRFFGAISYSLYLWHWPVLVLARYYEGGRVETGLETAAYIGLSILLAWLSWYFIEQPFRREGAFPVRRLFPMAVAGSAALLMAGGVAYVRNGMPERFDPATRTHIEASADFIQDWSRCYVSPEGSLKGIEVCPIGPVGTATFLVWGDSHARALKEGLAHLADERGTPGLLIWRAGCPPLFDVVKQESAATRQQDRDCTDANARIRAAMAEMPHIQKLLLIGRWSYYAEGSGTGNDIHNTITLSSSLAGEHDQYDQRQLFASAVDATITESRKWFKEVFVLRQIPELPLYDSREIARKLARGGHGVDAEIQPRLSVDLEEVRGRLASSEPPFAKLADDGKIVWLDPQSSFCIAENCSVMQGDKSYYFDNNHITNFAAVHIRNVFDPVMDTNVASAE